MGTGTGNPQYLITGIGEGTGMENEVGYGDGNLIPLPYPPHCHPYLAQRIGRTSFHYLIVCDKAAAFEIFSNGIYKLRIWFQNSWTCETAVLQIGLHPIMMKSIEVLCSILQMGLHTSHL
ncbi:hypothetical protein RchiOBHm_Chr6g0261121 [Rosa chinensis]|uniref:Uncharacterized protein n=1 Tax=Rosa chinensis TaxID=74649 RepID=A0A2P6PNA5_ROSCH|nr:hypothetical protein RchiOBHm_Chr6g0261121 [Rosa chinensis]